MRNVIPEVQSKTKKKIPTKGNFPKHHCCEENQVTTCLKNEIPGTEQLIDGIKLKYQI